MGQNLRFPINLVVIVTSYNTVTEMNEHVTNAEYTMTQSRYSGKYSAAA